MCETLDVFSQVTKRSQVSPGIARRDFSGILVDIGPYFLVFNPILAYFGYITGIVLFSTLMWIVRSIRG